MRIHQDHNLVYVNAISYLSTGRDVKGHLYNVGIGTDVVEIKFQHGPVKEHGVNGLTNESLLAILKHRLEYLNEQFPCDENEVAITCVSTALEALEQRTKDRLSRGVEGRNLV